MKKAIIIGLALAISFAFTTSMALAAPKPTSTYDPFAPNVGKSGKSGVAHMYLVEKNPSDWTIVGDGAWGKLTHKEDGGEDSMDSFVFNGHGLVPGMDYTLIEYPKPQTTWPWPVNVLASGTANSGGNINLSGEYEFVSGQYIWLVLTDDIASDELSGWNPTEYLFEYDPLS